MKSKTKKVEGFFRLRNSPRISKKAQVANQVFVFILALVLAAMVMLYGYKAIFAEEGFIGRTEQISLVRFETELTNAVNAISSDYGSVDEVKLTLPSKYERICLVQLSYQDKSNTGLCQPNHNDYEPIICDAWKDNAQNVFLVPMADSPIIVSKLEIDGGYVCPPVLGGHATIWLEGKGDRVKVEE